MLVAPLYGERDALKAVQQRGVVAFAEERLHFPPAFLGSGADHVDGHVPGIDLGDLAAITLYVLDGDTVIFGHGMEDFGWR